MVRKNIVRVPKNLVRIACLHVLHSAVSTTAIKFWYGKIKFWYEFWAQFFGRHTKKPPHGTHAASFIQTWRRKSIRWVPPHKKRTSVAGIWSIWSTEVNKPVSLVRFGNKSILSLFSNFNWTFLYASSFRFRRLCVIQTEKYRFLFYDFKKKLTSARIFPGYTTRFLSRLLLCWLCGSHLE